MRELGIPKLLTWRWTPFAALVLGSLSFVGFATLVIPDHIGHPDGESAAASLNLGNAFARAQPGATPASNWSSDDSSSSGEAPPSPVARAAANVPNLFPKRGFSPPLERAESPPPPPPVPAQLVAPAAEAVAAPPPPPPPPPPPEAPAAPAPASPDAAPPAADPAAPPLPPTSQ